MQAQVFSEILTFEAFGVVISINCNDAELLAKIKKVLPTVVPERLKIENYSHPEHCFYLAVSRDPERYELRRNNEDVMTYWHESRLIEYLSSQIRITVAEFAKDLVFVHSGAVGWKGSGIIIPGKSFSGKTTLVSEFIKTGAEYYSDEYAVLDKNGYLHPYPKMLSMRGIVNDFDQIDTEPAAFGAAVAKHPVPVKFILLTSYEKNAEWQPQLATPGEAVIEILKDTIPIRLKPEFVLTVLKNIVKNAIILKSQRGETTTVIPQIISYIENFSKF